MQYTVVVSRCARGRRRWTPHRTLSDIDELNVMRTETSITASTVSAGQISSVKHGQHWTPAEDRYLMQHYGTKSVEECCTTLNRTIASVHYRASLLGVRAAVFWSDEEDSILRANVFSGLPTLQKLLGRSSDSIRSRLRLLGLTTKRPIDEKTAVKLLRTSMPIYDIAKQIGTSPRTISIIAARHGLTRPIGRPPGRNRN